MTIELALTTQTLLNEIAMKQLKRDDIALTYHLALKSSDTTDWITVNKAIIKRWSRSGLRYIKDKAWKMRES